MAFLGFDTLFQNVLWCIQTGYVFWFLVLGDSSSNILPSLLEKNPLLGVFLCMVFSEEMLPMCFL